MINLFCCFANFMEFISKYWLFGLGFFAQGLFGLRLLIQLFLSEKAGKSVSPTIFWQISLLASFLFLTYGVIREDAVIIIGQSLSYLIYIRNLQLKGAWKTLKWFVRLIIFLLPITAWLWILTKPESLQQAFSSSSLLSFWAILGTCGMLMLNLRYLYQWYRSEQEKESVLPFGFWVISAVASLIVVFYGYQKSDPVLIVSQGMGLVVYLRNCILGLKGR
jgi:lipid-A-disaccharide synthase-like uncharacterized protein